jgi:predicted enzyme related to lactoylglutathione lyase
LVVHGVHHRTPAVGATPELADQVRALVQKGAFGIGVFDTDDCQATDEALKAKGAQFLSPQTDRFCGIEALVRDNSGNWFSMTQHKK